MQIIHAQLTSIVTAAGAVFVSLATGCNKQPAASSDQAAQASATQTPAVKVVKPERKDVRRLIERPGFNIEAYERTPLYARIAGYVRKWHFDLGDQVKKDDVLAEIWVPEKEVELKQKEASVLQAEAEIRQARATVLGTQYQLQRTKTQYERLARVGRSGVLEQEQVDEVRLKFDATEAAL